LLPQRRRQPLASLASFVRPSFGIRAGHHRGTRPISGPATDRRRPFRSQRRVPVIVWLLSDFQRPNRPSTRPKKRDGAHVLTSDQHIQPAGPSQAHF